MPCCKHGGKNDWRNCPNNKYRRPQSKSQKEKEAKTQKKDLHSVQREDAATKKNPIVWINELEAGTNNHYQDLDYLSDDSLAMMVQAPNNNKLVTGITVVELQDKEGKRHTTTILIDTGFTGYTLMSHQFAEQLGYKFQPKSIQSYHTVTRKMETGCSVTIANIRLPALSRCTEHSMWPHQKREISDTESSRELV